MNLATSTDLAAGLDQLFDPAQYSGHRSIEQFKFAGLNLIQEINDLQPDLVIDAGCGHNRFKGHILNLIGFDRINFPFIDLQMSIEDAPFREECADVVMSLGSAHFGTKQLVETQVDKMVSWTKPGGFLIFRVNYKLFINDPHNVRLNWSLEDLEYFTNKHQLSICQGPFMEDRVSDANPENLVATKMVWWWQKPGKRVNYSINPIDCEVTAKS